jgi:hypothetical protein
MSEVFVVRSGWNHGLTVVSRDREDYGSAQVRRSPTDLIGITFSK